MDPKTVLIISTVFLVFGFVVNRLLDIRVNLGGTVLRDTGDATRNIGVTAHVISLVGVALFFYLIIFYGSYMARSFSCFFIG
jgi:uncharacterized membrane protein